MIAEYDCGKFSGHRLEVTEEEVVIAGLKLPVFSAGARGKRRDRSGGKKTTFFGRLLGKKK